MIYNFSSGHIFKEKDTSNICMPTFVAVFCTVAKIYNNPDVHKWKKSI